MKHWTFKIFGKEKSDVDKWIEDLSPKAQARLDIVIAYMEITKDWSRTKYFSLLRGHPGIGEIRFTFQNKQYRPLGCYGPGQKEFTILVGAMEKGDRFNPINAPLKAEKRRKNILNKREQTHGYSE